MTEPAGKTLGELVRELEGRGMLRTVLAPEAATRAVSGIDFDSRQVEPGHVFVAVVGA